MKVVPRRCIDDPEQCLYQYITIAVFLEKLFKWYTRRGIRVECVQTDNGFEVFHLQTVSAHSV